MGLALPSFAERLFSPPAAGPRLCRPNPRWARGASSRAGLLRLRVAEVVVETPSTRTFVLDDEAIAYLAGQHLTVVAHVDGRSVRRCYSLSSSPAAAGRPAITVKRVEGGVLSNWLHDHVKAGDVLRAAPAAGRFTVEPDASRSRHLALVAGGVGITPLVAIAETVLREEKDSRVTLLYGSRSADEVIFRSRLEEMERAFPRRLEVILAVDEATDGWTGLTGPLAGERVVAATRGQSPDAWFVCGPEAMMDGVVAALEASGVAADRIHTERFQYAEAGAVKVPTQAGTLVFAKSDRAAIAPAGTTILDAAEQAGVALPSSCRMGGCGACKVKVDGRVVAAEPNCLTGQEKADGYALACCSYADGRVVLPEF